MKTLSLRTKLLLSSALVSVILLAAAYKVVVGIVKQAESDVLDSYAGLATGIGSSIAAQFYERYGDVQAFALNPVFKTSNAPAISTLLNDYVRLYGIYSLIVYTDARGTILATNTISANGQPIPEARKLWGQSYASAPWYAEVSAGRFSDDPEAGFAGTYVEDAHEDPIATQAYGTPMFGNSFSAPVRDVQGKIQGVISNRSDWKWVEGELELFLAKAKASGMHDVEMTVLNKDGAIISELDGTVSSDGKVQRNLDVLGKFNLFEKKVEAALRLRDNRRGSIFSVHARKKIEQVAGFTIIADKKILPALSWGVLVRRPKDAAMNTVNRLKTTVFGVAAGFAFVLLLGGWYLSYWLTRVFTKAYDEIWGTSAKLDTFSQNLSTMAQDLSSSAARLSSNVERTVSSMEEIGSMVQRTTESCSEAKGISTSSNASARDATAAAVSMTQSMNDIVQSSLQIQELSQMIDEIEGRTKVINDIVFETRLLSFNASIEAARAGAQGRGFAVVAEEIGKLAQVSGRAAEEIRALITESHEKVRRVLDVIRSSVEAGKVVAQDCQAKIQQSSDFTQQISDSVSSISAAANEQSKGVEDGRNAMHEIGRVTHVTSSSASDLSTQAGALRSHSETLIRSIGTLRDILYGAVDPNTTHDTSAPRTQSAGEASSGAGPIKKKGVVTLLRAAKGTQQGRGTGAKDSHKPAA